MANNMKKMLADQQKINEAVKAVFNFFSDCPYATYVEAMAEAQTQIIGLMEMAKQQAAIHNANEEIQTSDITQFLMDVNSLYKVLRPFAEMVQQWKQQTFQSSNKAAFQSTLAR